MKMKLDLVFNGFSSKFFVTMIGIKKLQTSKKLNSRLIKVPLNNEIKTTTKRFLLKWRTRQEWFKPKVTEVWLISKYPKHNPSEHPDKFCMYSLLKSNPKSCQSQNTPWLCKEAQAGLLQRWKWEGLGWAKVLHFVASTTRPGWNPAHGHWYCHLLGWGGGPL